MSNIKTKPEHDPFKNPLAPKPHTVGGSYGERRAMRIDGPTATPSGITKSIERDQFTKATKKTPDIQGFVGADYNQRRSYAQGVPHKRWMHDMLENGKLVQKSAAAEMTEEIRLKILDTVIANPNLHDFRAIQKAKMAAQQKNIKKP